MAWTPAISSLTRQLEWPIVTNFPSTLIGLLRVVMGKYFYLVDNEE